MVVLRQSKIFPQYQLIFQRYFLQIILLIWSINTTGLYFVLSEESIRITLDYSPTLKKFFILSISHLALLQLATRHLFFPCFVQKNLIKTITYVTSCRQSLVAADNVITIDTDE